MTHSMTDPHLTVNRVRPFAVSTCQRFEAIADHIPMHETRIRTLQAIASGAINRSQTGCTPAIRAYRRTKADQARLPHTLANLQRQIDLLHHEREVLKRYGR